MKDRRNEYDVTNRVNLSDPSAVFEAVRQILSRRYPGIDTAPIRKAFDTFTQLYAGILPGYHGCDTWYHDAQHTLDCTLAMARLLDGHDRSASQRRRLGARRATLGVICALFHDSGYIRRWSEPQFHNGAEFTLYHVTRSGEFLAEFLPTAGFGRQVELARQLVHFTGYEIALDKIKVRGAKDRQLGFLLGTADLLAQMSDRCYLEKCRKFLYHEFEACGLAGSPAPGAPKPVYASPEDLIRQTPEFVDKLFSERLDGYFEGAHRYMAIHFGHDDPYVAQIREHLRYVEKVIRAGNLQLLRRRPRSINAHRLRQLLNVRLSQVHTRREAAVPARRRARARPPGKRRLANYIPI